MQQRWSSSVFLPFASIRLSDAGLRRKVARRGLEHGRAVSPEPEPRRHEDCRRTPRLVVDKTVLFSPIFCVASWFRPDCSCDGRIAVYGENARAGAPAE